MDAFESVTYTPSGRVLRLLQQLGEVELKRCATLFYARADDLPNVRREAAAVRKVLVGEDQSPSYASTPDQALRVCSQSSLVHFACHGVWAPDDAYCSGVQLKGDGEEPGLLSFARILAEGDFRNTGLINLAGCATGASAGTFATGHSYVGLDAAFLARGARTVVSTLWEIDDLASLLFHLAFYAGVRAGDSVERAHKTAVGFLRSGGFLPGRMPPGIEASLSEVHPQWKRELKEREYSFEEPFFWGAFKCSGRSWDGLRGADSGLRKDSLVHARAEDLL